MGGGGGVVFSGMPAVWTAICRASFKCFGEYVRTCLIEQPYTADPHGYLESLGLHSIIMQLAKFQHYNAYSLG